MDERETALIDACLLAGIEIYDEEAESIIKLLRERGFTIIHRDENHGPTLERAAEVAGRIYAQDAFHFELGTACAAAIRAMEVK